MSSRVTIARLQIESLAIPFKVSFRHASAERAETLSVWVQAESSSGVVGRGESCPRSYVTGETLESARAFFDAHESGLRERVHDLASLTAWMTAHVEEIDRNPAAWCAIELSLLDLLGKSCDQPVEVLLSRPRIAGRFQYTAVLGDADGPTFRATAERYLALGFKDFKVKLSGDVERDREKLAVLRTQADVRVRGDANNLWDDGDEAVREIAALDFQFFALEEPIAANQHAALAKVGQALGTRIVLDESFLRLDQLSLLSGAPGRWIINVRVSKMGGLLRSLAIADRARAAGIGVVVGAQVGETSLLTRAGLTVARACGSALVAQEGAFGTFLLERDICDPPLMFGKGGVLDAAKYEGLARPGLGL